MKRICNKMICLILCAAVFTSATTVFADKTDEFAPNTESAAVKAPIRLYSEYLQQNRDELYPDTSIRINGNSYTNAADPDAKTLEEFHGAANTLATGSSGFVEWEFDVPEQGLYSIAIRYCPIPGKGNAIERSFRINGTIPYDDLNSVSFVRMFRNEAAQNGSVAKDSKGNDLRPRQVEAPEFRVQPLTGSLYNAGSELKVKLNQGKNTLRITSVKEPMAIDYIEFYNPQPVPAYKETKAGYPQGGAVKSIYLEGEAADLKSDVVLYPVNDRSSPLNSPYDASKIVMNAIGGNNWKAPKQWLEWKFDVETSGLYKLHIRGKQETTPGAASYRKIMIDGALPFQEAESVAFPYRSGWQVFEPGNREGAYLFYLEEGPHTLTLQCNVGDVADILEQLNSCISRLNDCYRSVFMITGSYPDADRDYDLAAALPDLSDKICGIYEDIRQIKQQMLALADSKGNGYSVVEKMEVQLQSFLKDIETLPARLNTFQTNISNLSDFFLTSLEQPLLIDWIEFVPSNAKASAADAGFFGRLFYDIQSFIVSFMVDYNAIALNDAEVSESIALWMGGSPADAMSTGRDQATTLKTIVENVFVAQKKIGVNIRLVDMAVLLPAVSAGRGPDVAIGLTTALPMNYAYRGAVYDLSNFEDLPQVTRQFHPEALTQFRYHDHVYALPDRYSFYMMFYRKDILNELGLTVPTTWDDVYTMLPKLQNKHMEIGIPNLADNNIDLFTTLLFQQNGNVYDDALTRSTLDSDESIQAFKKWTDFYTKYKVSQKLNHLTRFRTGNAPIVFMPYTFYTNLQAAAPEIKGLWGFTSLPGTRYEDGTVNSTVSATATGSLIFSNSKHKAASWEFLKWWVSEDVQAMYGMEIENLQGPAGRYQTANTKALEKLPWSNEELSAIQKSWQFTKAVPEAPGGYMTSRYIITAASLVINNGLVPRESIIDHNQMIDDEVKSMRKKFGLE